MTKENIQSRLTKIEEEIGGQANDLSNHQEIVKKCLSFAQNLNPAWVSANLEAKQVIYKMIFLEDIMVII